MIEPKQMDRLLNLKGWCDEEKAQVLYGLVRGLANERRPPGSVRGLEIGVYGGRSLFAAAMGLRDSLVGGYIVGVDPYDYESALEDVTDPEHAQYWLRHVDLFGIFTEAWNARYHFQLERFCGFAVAPAQRLAAHVEELDYLHIDGNHAEGPALRDARMWAGKVRPGGIIVIDDCDWPSVRPAWDLVARGRDLIHRVERVRKDKGCDYAVYRVPPA